MELVRMHHFPDRADAHWDSRNCVHDNRPETAVRGRHRRVPVSRQKPSKSVGNSERESHHLDMGDAKVPMIHPEAGWTNYQLARAVIEPSRWPTKVKRHSCD
jgi:hypothetical protein